MSNGEFEKTVYQLLLWRNGSVLFQYLRRFCHSLRKSRRCHARRWQYAYRMQAERDSSKRALPMGVFATSTETALTNRIATW